MAAVSSEAVPGARHQLAQRLRAAVLGPRGGGTTRRRASDAFRLGLAVVVVAVSIPVMKANSAAELSIVHVLHPPPAAISWLVTIGLLARLGRGQRAAGHRRAARPAAVRGPVDRSGCRADLGRVHRARRLLGPAAGRPPVSELAGVNAGYPVTAARGRDRRGGDRASVSEPSGAPAGVVPGRRGGAGRGLRRGSASGQRRLERRAGVGRRRGPAPGRGLTAGPAVGGGGHRRGSRT